MADSNVYELIIKIEGDASSSSKVDEDGKPNQEPRNDKAKELTKKKTLKSTVSFYAGLALSVGKQVVGNIGTRERNNLLQTKINSSLKMVNPISLLATSISGNIKREVAMQKEIHKTENIAGRSGYMNRSR